MRNNPRRISALLRILEMHRKYVLYCHLGCICIFNFPNTRQPAQKICTLARVFGKAWQTHIAIELPFLGFIHICKFLILLRKCMRFDNARQMCVNIQAAFLHLQVSECSATHQKHGFCCALRMCGKGSSSLCCRLGCAYICLFANVQQVAQKRCALPCVSEACCKPALRLCLHIGTRGRCFFAVRFQNVRQIACFLYIWKCADVNAAFNVTPTMISSCLFCQAFLLQQNALQSCQNTQRSTTERVLELLWGICHAKGSLFM